MQIEASPDGGLQQHAAPRLLIVDDIADNRAILGRRFERRGYEIVEADGGLPALELIAQQSFDLVLLDVMMPDMDGLDVLRRIREQHSSALLPVIMVTAKSQSEDVVQALTTGANDYVTKPVDFAVALARVEAHVDRKRANEALARANDDLERRIAERTGELRAAMEQAQAANRSKDEFLTNMSHELRTPLNGVIGVAQVLETTDLNPQQREMVGVIGASGAALQSVLSDLLDLVDLTSGRVELACEPVRLGEFVRTVASGQSPKAERKGLAFELEVAPEVEGEVEADPSRLRQVLLNLLGNAVKFTQQGRIRLEVRRSPGAPDRVVFQVIDTGVGFDPATTERLFKPFEQADGSLTRRFGGAGLGLAICRQLIQQMHGTITAESRPGEGATFRVELPLPELSRSGGTEEAGEGPAEGRALHVLCAEDHPANRKLVELIMAAAGVALTSVENGAEAVEAYKAEAFDAVLMDMQMPVMDGLTATRAIREFERAEGRPLTPVIMVTAHGLPEHQKASREAGADRHITKPLVPGDLLRALSDLVMSRAEKGGPEALSA